MKNASVHKMVSRSLGLRDELLRLIQKAEGMAREGLKDDPPALKEVLGACGKVRKTVAMLMANPKTLTRLSHDLAIEISILHRVNGQKIEMNEGGLRQFLAVIDSIREEAEGILADRTGFISGEK